MRINTELGRDLEAALASEGKVEDEVLVLC